MSGAVALDGLEGAPGPSGAPVKLTYVIDDLGMGGAQVHLVALASALAAEGRYDVEIVSLGPVSEKLARLLDARVPVSTFRMSSVRKPSFALELVRLVRHLARRRPAIVHTYLNTAGVFGLMAARLAGVPAVATSRRDMGVFRSSRVRALEGVASRWADRVFCVCEAVAQATRVRERVPQAKLATIRNGIDTAAIPPRGGGSREGVFRLAMVAAMNRTEKGHRELVEAMALARRASARPLKLELVGDGPLRPELEGLATRLGLADVVDFQGERKDVVRILREVDILVVPSHTEGISNAALEAMAVGLPVIATAVDGNLETVADGVTGALVPPSAPQALADAIVAYARDPDAAERHGRAARARAESRFGFGRMVEEYDREYRRLAVANGGRAAADDTVTGPSAAGAPSRGGQVDRATLALSIGLVLVLGLLNGARRSIWTDEAYTLYTLQRGLVDVLRRAAEFEQQPPLYFALARVWTYVSASLEWTRAFSTLAAVGTVCLLGALGRVAAASAGLGRMHLLAALCPFLLWSASEARSYALALMLNAAAMLFFTRFWALGDRSRRNTALYVGAAYLSLLTFHLSAFLLAAMLLAAFASRERRRWALGCGAALALLFAPWAPVALSQIRFEADSVRQAPPGGGGPVAAQLLQTLFLQAPIVVRPSFRWACVAVVAGIVLGRWLVPRARWTSLEGMFAATAILPFVAVFSLHATSLADIETRHYAPCVVNAIALLVLLASRVRAPARAALGALLALLFAAATLSFQRHNQSPSDWRSVAAYLNARAGAGEPLLFDASALPFRYYDRRATEVHGVPSDENLQRYERWRFVVRSEEEVAGRVRELVAPGQSFWLVRNGRGNPERGGPILLEWVYTRLEVLEVTRFTGVEVLHLRAPTAPAPVGAIRTRWEPAGRAAGPGSPGAPR